MPVTNVAQHGKVLHKVSHTAALLGLSYTVNFQTLWQDTNAHLANQTTQIHLFQISRR